MMESSQASSSAGDAQSQFNRESQQRRESAASEDSQTAKDFIESQLRLEADAREALPYSFDSCTQPLGPLRQPLFSCLTCNPPPENENEPYNAAAVCYSCSISCHGDHTLVELFSKRNFVCDCGTTRFPATSPCTLRVDPATGSKGVHSQKPAEGNAYNHNFRNRFCVCNEEYDPHKEKGTMFQCLGLGTAETGGCGEDWWHPECLVGLPRGWHKATATNDGTDGTAVKSDESDDDEEPPLPPGFPEEDDFEAFICYKCLESAQWLKRYAGTKGFLAPVYKDGGLKKVEAVESSKDTTEEATASSLKRKNRDDDSEETHNVKRTKSEDTSGSGTTPQEARSDNQQSRKHASLPKEAPSGTFSLFMKEDFRDHLCHCPECFPLLVPHPQLREEEEVYEPPLSEDGDGNEANGGGSHGTGSLYERGEAALSTIDRVRAIEGVMAYNHLRDKVKEFLKPFAESGRTVSAEDVKAYFEKLRGDNLAGAARESVGQAGSGSGGEGGDHRREQSGY
ncbi:hypothetical protein VTN49DRAFT_2398 [Thermomyces lanuginosus]|uniref:uncharacterized protein n=1 Tax=Thermomyces lanuginosus TaxID=5541 RepID=UPI00374270BD